MEGLKLPTQTTITEKTSQETSSEKKIIEKRAKVVIFGEKTAGKTSLVN